MGSERKSRLIYVHTLDGRPAQYDEGEQVCYLGRRPLERWCTSLRQLRREQQKSVAWRLSLGFPGDHASLGYFKMRLP